MANFVVTKALIGLEDFQRGVGTFSRTTSTGGSQTLTKLGGIVPQIAVATDFSGADIGAQVNAAYAALPSSGGKIIVPVGGNFSTPIVFGTNAKPAILQGFPGNSVTLTYTGSSGTALTYNSGTGHGMGAGFRDLTLTGPGNSSSTTGVIVGGTNGGEGTGFENFKIQSFGTNLTFGSNTWIVRFAHGMIRDAGTLVNFPTGLTQAGENILFQHVTFADAPTPFTNAVWIHAQQVGFDSCSFDQAQLRVGDSSAGVGAQVFCYGCHFENPNLGATYDWVLVDNVADNVLYLTDCDLTQALTSTAIPEFMTVNGGTVVVRGFNMFTPAGSPFTNFAVINNAANFTIQDFDDLSGNISGTLLAGNSSGWVTQMPGANPGSAARNTVIGKGRLDAGTGSFDLTSSATTSATLNISALASQTADLQDWRATGGTPVLAVQPSGNLVFSAAGAHLNQGAASQDLAGVISLNGATSGAHNFATAFSNAPVAIVTPTSNLGAITYWVTTSTTAITVHTSSAATATFNYIVIGSPN